MISTEMGCVAITQRFNLMYDIQEQHFADALNYCQLTLRPHVHSLKDLGWDRVIGASGSIKAISEILVGNQWSSEGITLEGMQKLSQHLIKSSQLESVKLTGLSDDRKPVIGGGLAVLMATFQLLDIDRMLVSQGALREGLILDMLGRVNHTQDVRESSIQALITSSRIDTVQAQRVASCAEAFFEQVSGAWQLVHTSLDVKLLLRWAALTHEVGYFISSRRYRHHTAYILQHADLAGFSQYEQGLLAWMGLHHRSKVFPADLNQLTDIDHETAHCLVHLMVILRLAVRLHRGRDNRLPPVKFEVQEKQVTLLFESCWLEKNPLTYMDLMSESKRLEVIGFNLRLQDTHSSLITAQ
jgi:exopolyphosphatase/guanosine-5'-triphosphate,3'-diphosphate pyrophosphatase